MVCGEAARRRGLKKKQTNVIRSVRERYTLFIGVVTFIAGISTPGAKLMVRALRVKLVVP